MKEGWKMVKLGEVCEIRPSRSQSFKKLKDTDKVSFLPMEDLGVYDRVINASKTKTLKEVSGSYTYFENGDVLLAKVTPCFENGKLGIAYNLINGIGFGSSEYIVFRPSNIINSEYVYYNLANAKFREGGKRLMLGACGLKRLSKDYVNNYKIPLPPLEEQHRIVGILDAAFAKIDALKKNAEENLKNAKALFQQVLAQELKPKEGWVEKKLENVCKIINGYAFQSSDFKKNNEIKAIKITNVGVGKFIEEDDNKLPLKYLSDVSDVIVKESDIVIALTRTIIAEGLKVAIVPQTYDGALLNQRVAALRMHPDVLLQEYLYYYFQTKYASEYVLSRVNTLMQPNLSIKDLRNMPIPYISIYEQHRIVSTLDTLSEKCRRLEQVAQQTIRECDALKQSILRKAFSGEL